MDRFVEYGCGARYGVCYKKGMSDNAQIFVQLDPLEDSVRKQIADRITKALLDRRIIEPLRVAQRGFSDEPGQTDWDPGPAWHGEAVTIVPGVSVQFAAAATEPWRCLKCDAELDDDDYSCANEWDRSKIEPIARCESCGWVAPLGNWPSRGPAFLLGGPSVIFNNWDHIDESFVEEVKTLLGGGRWRYLWQHI